MDGEQQPVNATPKYVLTAVVAFLVGFGSAWLYLDGNVKGLNVGENKDGGEKSLNKGEKATITIGTSGMLAESSAIVVNDQSPGIEVLIAKTVFEKGGWVVIHEDDGEGASGKILGAQLFDPGSFDNGKVELLRGTIEGGTYFAMLHSDNGDRAFDPKLDTPILGKTGAPIMMEFTATETAPSVETEVSI